MFMECEQLHRDDIASVINLIDHTLTVPQLLVLSKSVIKVVCQRV